MAASSPSVNLCYSPAKPAMHGSSTATTVSRSASAATATLDRKTWFLSRCLLIWSQPDSAEDHRLWRDLLAQCLQGPTPAKIVRQVFRRDAMEATQPFFQPAMVGIDVVEMEIRRLGVWFTRHRQDMGWDRSPPRKGNDRGAAITTELVGRGDHAAQRRGDGDAVQSRQHRIRGGAFAVARNDHRNLFSGQATFGRFATSLARLSRHARSLALERLQNECLVAFDDPGQRLGLIAGQSSQKPVSPAKRGCIMHTASCRGFGGADAIDQGFGLRRPFVLHAQIRQRRFRQGVERAPTGFAAVARQSARLAPTYDVAVVAVRATNAVHPALPEVSDTGRLE